MRFPALMATLLLAGAALAQGPGGSGGPGGPPGGGPPQLPAKFSPLFTLIGDVMSLDSLTGSDKLKLDAAEKKSLRALLIALAAKKSLSPTEAGAADQKLQKALSAPHRKQLASLRGPGGMPPPPPDDAPPPGPPPDGRPGGPPPGGFFEALRTGKPFNPLGPSDPVAGRATKNLIARLGKSSKG